MNQIKQIDYFLAVVRENSFTRAARSLYLSQSSLSQYIHSLEEQIGLPLLSRSKNSPIKLTEAGELYYAAALQIEAIRNMLDIQLEKLKGKNRNNITWGHAGKQGIYVLSLLLPLFPDLEFSIIQSSAEQLERMLLSGMLDIACSAVFKKNPALAYYKLRSDTLDIAVSSSHPLASLGSDIAGNATHSVSISQFADASFILQCTSTIIRQEINQLFKKTSIVPRIELEVESTFYALSTISSGKTNYITIVPSGYSYPGVRFIRLKEQQTYSIYLYCRQEMASMPIIGKIFSEAKKIPFNFG